MVNTLEIEFVMSRNESQNYLIRTLYTDNFALVRDGFWVNDRGEFAENGDEYAFVFPHMINYCLKVEL